MSSKMSSAIEHITLNAATFHNVAIDPTFINFFYGNNGTGKTTISTEILAGNGLSWQAGKSAADYSVLVYNQAFVAANFQDYGKLKGVFTVGEQNIKIQNDVAEKSAQRADQERQNGENNTAKERKEAERDRLLASFQDTCWTKGKALRDGFDAALWDLRQRRSLPKRSCR